MDSALFISSLSLAATCLQTSPVLRALWFDYHNQWGDAHDAIQNEDDPLSAAVHAYLHRKEGDTWNANYWYRNAKRKPFLGSFEQEWQALVSEECSRLGVKASELPINATQSSLLRD